MDKRYFQFLTLAFTVMLLSACVGAPTDVPEVQDSEPPPQDAPASTEAPVATEAPTEPPAESPPPEPSGMPAKAQRVEFQAEDAHNLVGYYYPSAYANAPVVVLMHWARGDQTDWQKVGLSQWLQNRLSENPIPPDQAHIYPSMPEGLSFAVLSFDFRGFGESGPGGDPTGWRMDAQAAYDLTRDLPGVNPMYVAGIGSSIGADGVIDGCTDRCLGALSLSPGSYLGVPYAEAVKLADQEGKPVRCIAAESDGESAPTCRSASGDNYDMFIYPGYNHGTQFLMEPNIPEDIGQSILDWLLLVFSEQP